MRKIEDIDEIDKLLYENCPIVEELLLDNLPKEEDIEYEFSRQFEKNMKKMIKGQKRGYLVSKFYKISKIVAVIVVAISISLFSFPKRSDAFRFKLFEIIREVYEEFSIHIYQGKNDKKTEDINDLKPGYIPKGFDVIKETEEEEYILITYKNNLEYIKYQCFEINNNRLYIDTENAKVTEVLIDGINADYIDKGAFQMISWEKDGYGYNLSVESIDENYVKFDKEELMKIAESIK